MATNANETLKKIAELLGVSSSEKSDSSFGSGSTVKGTTNWLSFLGGNTNPDTTTPPEPSELDTIKSTVSQLESSRPEYKVPQAVLDAETTLKNWESQKPGAYQSNYADQIQQLYDKIMNRDQFSYDFNADPRYQQYKDQYVQGGKMAMQDTMANAAALTGGYGNSYASTAGNQAYQAYLQQLNNVIPQLQQNAFAMYEQQGNDMINQLGIAQGLEDTAYGRYMDDLNAYYNDLNYYYAKYKDMSQEEYNRYLNDLDAWMADRAYYYGKQQDAQSQANWDAENGGLLNRVRSSSSGGSRVSSSSSGSSSKSSGSSGSKKSDDDDDDDADGTEPFDAKAIAEKIWASVDGKASNFYDYVKRLGQDGLYTAEERAEIQAYLPSLVEEEKKKTVQAGMGAGH